MVEAGLFTFESVHSSAIGKFIEEFPCLIFRPGDLLDRIERPRSEYAVGHDLAGAGGIRRLLNHLCSLARPATEHRIESYWCE